jgi:H2-forming N5,N10-methylenetetrahydromethanopterin dehydrogenase-like enzyme
MVGLLGWWMVDSLGNLKVVQKELHSVEPMVDLLGVQTVDQSAESMVLRRASMKVG